METTVELQRMMRYSKLPIIIVGALLAIVTALIISYVVYRVIKLIKANRKPTIKAILWTKPNMDVLRAEYLNKLEAVEREFKNNPTAVRPTYEKLSKIIRNFAYQATGIEVQKYSLNEIRGTYLQGLADLIEEFYAPEFDKISSGDVITSIDKTKRMISAWN